MRFHTYDEWNIRYTNIVFIDDLDRLAPSKVLKLFLDCNNCVYVLAIDYDVVTRGISEKYGADFGEKQGKKFFDTPH